VKHVHAIEIEPAFVCFLRDNCTSLSLDNVDIIEGDALTLDFPQSMDKIISAVPYAISAPLTFKILEYLVANRASARLIYQKEFGEKMLAQAGSMAYGRLSASVSLLGEAVPLLDISKNNFFPVPKVHSILIGIAPRESIDANLGRACMELLRGLFPFKNKMLLKAMAMYLENEGVAVARKDLDTMPCGDKRVRELDRDDILALAKWFSARGGR
jgi:16S rRNA (adenine1518-N6/adenine1519-N6)-dimethyltransferase